MNADHRDHHDQDQRQFEHAPLMGDEYVEVKVGDRARHADHDAGEDDQRHAVADAALGDLLAQPHDEGGAGGERENRHQGEPEAGVGHDVVLHRLQAHGDSERLRDAEADGQVAGPLSDLAAAEFAFLLKLFQRGNDDRQQLQDDRRRDVRHDAEREDRQAPDIAAGEEIEETEDAARLARQKVLPANDVDARRRNVTAEPVNGEHGECKKDAVPEILNPEDIAYRFKQLAHRFLAFLTWDYRCYSTPGFGSLAGAPMTRA